jgi:arginine decarboxylase
MKDAARPPPETAPWTAQDSAELYGLHNWGSGYFGVSDNGTLEVYPSCERDQSIDLMEVVEGLQARDLWPPVVIRFSGILEHRMAHLRRAWDEAILEGEYNGKYTCVYPIKVNHQRHICEEIRERIGGPTALLG